MSTYAIIGISALILVLLFGIISSKGDKVKSSNSDTILIVLLGLILGMMIFHLVNSTNKPDSFTQVQWDEYKHMGTCVNQTNARINYLTLIELRELNDRFDQLEDKNANSR